MISLALYLVKVIICSGILFGYYWLALRNKIFHQYNRFYLLASLILSLALPLIEINIWQSRNATAPTAIRILQAVSSKEYLDGLGATSNTNNITAEQVLLLFYIVTCTVFLWLFVSMLIRIRSLFIRHRHSIVEGIYFVNTLAKGTPFSFLKYIFWNDLIDPATPTGRQVFKHELAHVRQKHSYDKLFVQAVLIIWWCNPFFWMIRKELNMIHEFVADKIAVEDNDTEAFAAMILQATYPRHNFQLTNPFFYSPIKRRLLMLTKNKNPKAGYIGRVLVLPLALFIFAAFTFKTNTAKDVPATIYTGKKITVVVDAGHGGSDKGALSLTGNIAEKDLNLSIIQKIKAANKNANINIVLTRESDVSQSLQEKVKFTKEQKAGLFISIHMDAATNEKAGLASGMSVWIAKSSFANSAGSKLFASAIINEFSTDYKLPVAGRPQQQETGIKVLQESPCPAVLIEAGYITNNNDLAFLQTDAAKEIIADKILAAITNYAFAKDKSGNALQTPEGSSTESVLTGSSPITQIDTIPMAALKPMEKALIIINGKTSTQKELKNIDPKSIESMHVLTGKQAIDEYGKDGKNGVVIVRTKEQEISLKNVNVVVHEKDTNTELQLSAVKIKFREGELPAPLPLFIVDGKEQNIGFELKSINTDNIERVDVLKGQNATAKYGKKANNGAIEITTKDNKGVNKITSTNALQKVESDDAKHENQDKIFTKVEYEPSFPGGDSAWRNYLAKNLKPDMAALEGWKPGVYKIILTFIVETDGKIADITADNYAGTKTAEHCIDLIKRGPRWEPASQNGHVVNCYRKQAISFIVP